MSDTIIRIARTSVLVPGAHIADPGPLGPGRVRPHHVRPEHRQRRHGSPATVEPVVFGLALAYGGIGQFAAGIWEFAKGNTFGATAFCSYGAFWVSFWWLTGHTDRSTPPAADAHKGVGLYLLAWGIFTAYMTVAATRVSGAVLAVFVLLTITFLLLAIGEFADVRRHHQARRLRRAADRARRLVRVVRRRHRVHLQAPGLPVGPREWPHR